jgi:hypothetical protein
MNNEKFETLIHIGKVFSEKSQAWLPSVQVLQPHDHDPAWTAALMYLVIDRYLSAVEDKSQEEYVDATLKMFNAMLEMGQNYIEKLNSVDELE